MSPSPSCGRRATDHTARATTAGQTICATIATRSASPTGPPVLAAYSSHRLSPPSTALTAIAAGTRRGSVAPGARLAASRGQTTSAAPPTATAAPCTDSDAAGSSRVAATTSPATPASTIVIRAGRPRARRPMPVMM